MTRFSALLLVFGLLPMSAFAQSAMPGMAMPTAPQSEADKALMGAMQTMSTTLPPMSGDPDRDFVAMMIPHHQAAIDMAQVELRYGKDAGLKAMATEIIAAQTREIDSMREWQAAHAK